MSIIYDALKKVQENIDTNTKIAAPDKKPAPFPPKPKPKPKPKLYLLYVLVLSLGLFAVNVFLDSHKTQLQKIKPEIAQAQITSKDPKAPADIQQDTTKTDNQTLPIPAPVKDQEPLILNGIFFSKNEGYALINNQIVKEGDVIDDSTVKKIYSDRVELEKAGFIIMLSTTKQ